MTLMSNDAAKYKDGSDSDDCVGDPHGPPSLKGTCLAEIGHQKCDRVVDQQDGQEAHDKAGDELSARLQHCKRPTQQSEKKTAAGHGIARVNFRCHAIGIRHRILFVLIELVRLPG